MALSFSLEERFDASPEAVTAAIADIDGYGDWMPNFVRLERLTDGDFGVGTRFRETRKIMGREGSEEFEVTAYEPGKRVELYIDGSKGTSKRGEYRFVYALEPDGGGTRLRLDGTIDGMGWLFSLLGKLFVGSFKKACAKDHAALRAHVDKAARGDAPGGAAPAEAGAEPA